MFQKDVVRNMWCFTWFTFMAKNCRVILCFEIYLPKSWIKKRDECNNGKYESELKAQPVMLDVICLSFGITAREISWNCQILSVGTKSILIKYMPCGFAKRLLNASERLTSEQGTWSAKKFKLCVKEKKGLLCFREILLGFEKLELANGWPNASHRNKLAGLLGKLQKEKAWRRAGCYPTFCCLFTEREQDCGRGENERVIPLWRKYPE